MLFLWAELWHSFRLGGDVFSSFYMITMPSKMLLTMIVCYGILSKRILFWYRFIQSSWNENRIHNSLTYCPNSILKIFYERLMLDIFIWIFQPFSSNRFEMVASYSQGIKDTKCILNCDSWFISFFRIWYIRVKKRDW